MCGIRGRSTTMAEVATAAPGIGIPALMKSVACGKRLNQTACLPGPPCLLCLRSGNRTAPRSSTPDSASSGL